MSGITKLMTAGGGGVALTPASSIASDVTVNVPSVNGTLLIPGQASAITAGTAVASTSGTSIDFTSIPSWVKRITVMFSAVSVSGTDQIWIRLGSAGGFVTSSTYNGTCWSEVPAIANFTTAFIVVVGNTAAGSWHGNIVFDNITSNVWTMNGSLSGSSAATIRIFSGSLDVGAALTQLRIMPSGVGSNTFDAGSINILYE